MRILLLLVCFTSCKQSVQTKWSNVVIDPKLSSHRIYSQLDKQKDIFQMVFDIDSTKKKTSDVTYVISLNERKLLYSSKNFNCSARLKSDTVSIDVGIGTGFSGSGFMLYYNKGKFYTQPYFWTDNISDNDAKSVFKIQQQNLTLNQRAFKVGDSLFGKVYFHVIETHDGMESQHFAEGFFRSKVVTDR